MLRHDDTCLLTIAVALWFGPSLHASDRYFRDFNSYSPDKTFRLEAKSPDNVLKPQRPWTKNFTYSLFNHTSGRLIWVRKQESKEPSPIGAYVGDNGWVVIRTAFDDLKMVTPLGKTQFAMSVTNEAIPAAEIRSNIGEDEIPESWAVNSYWYFIDTEGRPYFVVRTWWDRRVVIDLIDARQVSDTGILRKKADALEKDYVVMTLKRIANSARQLINEKAPKYSNSKLMVGERDSDGVDLLRAMHMAGRMRIEEAIPLLRILEQTPNFTKGSGYYENLQNGEIRVAYHAQHDTVRRMAQLSLRRLHEKPRELPVCQMAIKTGGGIDLPSAPYEPKAYSGPRSSRVDLVRKTMTPRELLDTIGAPDYIVFPGVLKKEYEPVWEYDIGDKTPYTLRIHWTSTIIKSMEHVKPAVWETGVVRDRCIYE